MAGFGRHRIPRRVLGFLLVGSLLIGAKCLQASVMPNFVDKYG